jgi:GxxExxY protein
MIKPQMTTDKEKEYIHKELTEKILSAAFKVHNTLGPGYLESIYQNAMVIELRSFGLKCDTEKLVEIFYNNVKVGEHRLDLVIDDKVIVELKAVSEFHPVHKAQIISYLKATRLKIALLLNFGTEKVEYKRFIL